jgi:hypothetical protein
MPDPKQRSRDLGRRFIPDEDFNQKLKEIVDDNFKDFKSEEGSPDMNKIIAFDAIKDKEGKRKAYYIMLAIHGDDWDNWEKRSAALEGLGMRLSVENKIQIGMAFMISEVWTSSFANKEDTKDCVAPHDDPNRREGVIVAGMTVDRRMNSAFAYLKEDRTLEEFDIIPFNETAPETNNRNLFAFFKGHVEGQVANLLKRTENND